MEEVQVNGTPRQFLVAVFAHRMRIHNMSNSNSIQVGQRSNRHHCIIQATYKRERQRNVLVTVVACFVAVWQSPVKRDGRITVLAGLFKSRFV